MLTRVSILLIISTMSFSRLIAEDGELEYWQHLTISEGLAHNGVTAILEDSRGYIWISTYDGLNRYDGYEFKTYKNTVDKRIIISNRVRTTIEDKNGIIWIGTDEGISTYDYSKEKFTNIFSNSFNKKTANEPIIRKIHNRQKWKACYLYHGR